MTILWMESARLISTAISPESTGKLERTIAFQHRQNGNMQLAPEQLPITIGETISVMAMQSWMVTSIQPKHVSVSGKTMAGISGAACDQG